MALLTAERPPDRLEPAGRERLAKTTREPVWRGKHHGTGQGACRVPACRVCLGWSTLSLGVIADYVDVIGW